MFSTHKIIFHPTHIGVSDGAMHKSIIHNRSRYLAFSRFSGSLRLRISLEELTEKAAIFGFLEYGSISNSDASYAGQRHFLKASLLDILLQPLFTSVSEMCVQSNFLFLGDGSTSKVTSSWSLLLPLTPISKSAELVFVLMLKHGSSCWVDD